MPQALEAIVKVTLEKKEKNQVLLEVEVETQRYDAAYDKAYRKVAQQVNIPGFRKGKAPRPVVERHVGPEYIKQEALEVLIPEVYTSAVEQEKLEPIAEPRFELVKAEKNEPVVFKATVEVRPEVKLGGYTEIEIAAPEALVTEEQVTERIDAIRRSRSQLAVVDRAVAMGDTATVDFAGTIDGVAFEGGTANDFAVEVAEGRFIPGFVEAMVGMKAGDSKDADLTFPEDYPNAELAGKAVKFAIAVKEVKHRELPELNEELAKEVGADSVEALQSRIREQLRSESEENREFELRKQLLEKVVANAEMDVPESMVEREVTFLLNQYANNLAQQGIDPNRVFTQENIQQWRENSREEASKRIRTSLTLGQIARQEGIEPTSEEIENAIGEYAMSYGMAPEAFRKQVLQSGAYAQIADEVLSNKIIEWLFERAKVSVSAPEAAETSVEA
jgi:trigger factor